LTLNGICEHILLIKRRPQIVAA